jgi:hypothetical protein
VVETLLRPRPARPPRGSDAGVCRDVQGLTKIGKLQEPEFTFRFSDVKAA